MKVVIKLMSTLPFDTRSGSVWEQSCTWKLENVCARVWLCVCRAVYQASQKAVKKLSSPPHYSSCLQPLLLVQTLAPPPLVFGRLAGEVSIWPIPSSPRRELLSTSNMDSLNTEGRAVACRGHGKSLNQELTNSTVDAVAMVQRS